MYACNCNQQSVQENISKKIIVIKLFTAILVGRINCVCTLAPVDTILWKFFSKRGYKVKERLQRLILMRFHTSSLSPSITMENYHGASGQ